MQSFVRLCQSDGKAMGEIGAEKVAESLLYLAESILQRRNHRLQHWGNCVPLWLTPKLILSASLCIPRFPYNKPLSMTLLLFLLYQHCRTNGTTFSSSVRESSSSRACTQTVVVTFLRK